MKYLFACGGTGGHINPALAIAGHIKIHQPDCEIAFIGNKGGMEETLVQKAGYEFHSIVISGFKRKLTPANIIYDIRTAVRVLSSSKKAGKIIKNFNPDIVIGTGGYVTGPVLRKANKMGIKTATHEQNAFPGITTKMLSKYVDLIMLAMPEAQKYLPEREYVHTGNPVRPQILNADGVASRQKLNIDSRPFVLSFGGSLGAEKINDAVTEFIAENYKTGKFNHYHATGAKEYSRVISVLNQKGIDLEKCDNIKVLEFIDNMDELMSAADLVVSRSGAITLSEIEDLGKASILIPSPNVTENHQYHNAMTLVNAGAAEIIEEKDLSGSLLIEKINSLCQNPQTISEMGKKALGIAVPDANQKIYDSIQKLLNR